MSISAPASSDVIPRPSFVIGITGNMDPDFDVVPESVLRKRLETVLLFLRYGAKCRDPRDLAKPDATFGAALRSLLPPEVDALDGAQLECVELEDWPGIGENTELILLTSLAPGADTIIVEVLEELKQHPLFRGQYDNGLPAFRARYRAVLPFPAEIYVTASTFKGDAEQSEDEKRRCFHQLTRDLPGVDIFTVREDRDLQSNTKPDYAADAKDSTLRRRRYQAAGEYVATFSDLLIAVYDDRFHSGSNAGSNEIVEAKRYGPTPGLLPVSRAVNWADNGPVLHMFHPRRKARKDNSISTTDADPRNSTPLRILHTYDLGPKDDETRDCLRDIWSIDQVAGTRETTLTIEQQQEGERLVHEYRKWQSRGNTMISRIAENLSGFNETAAVKGEFSALHGLCGVRVKDKNRKLRPLSEIEPELAEAFAGSPEVERHARQLESIAQLRRRTADVSSGHDRIAKTLLKTLIVLAFFTALSLHLFNHWHALGAENGHSTPSEPGRTEITADTPLDLAKLLFSGVALVLAVVGLGKFLLFTISKREEKRHDARALAEGLRVQFYWGLAGLRRTVAANYMQRLRSEMDWVRNAISSMTLPAERFQDSFLNLAKRDQLTLLALTVRTWIRPPMRTPEDLGDRSYDGNCQQDYFWNSKHDQADRLHYFHQAGSTIALAGLLHIFPVGWFATSKYSMHIMMGQPVFSVSAILVGCFCLIAATAIGDLRHERAHKAAVHSKPFRPMFYKKYKDWLRDLFSHRPSGRVHSDRGKSFRESIINLGFTLIPAVGILLISLGFCLLAPNLKPSFFPDPEKLGGILMGACLVGGALIVAYGERQLLSEHARQYAAAHGFFNSARRRLEQQLAGMPIAMLKSQYPVRWLDERIEKWRAQQAQENDAVAQSIPVPTQDQIREILEQIRSEGEAGFAEARENIHRLLFALGKEALDENSEWLVLHRSRPMEPVMAG